MTARGRKLPKHVADKLGPGGSHYGRNRNLSCPSCSISYDAFRCGVTFLQARRDIIAIGTDRKTGKTKYGRRNGVLGFMHELKMLAWQHHVADCAAAARKVAA